MSIHEAGCALEHKNKYELIICVVLSAQTTDKSVNKISDALFEKYPTPYDLAQAEQEDVIDIIRTIGMYKTKSKNIIALAKALVADFDGQVPGDYDQLIKLPGRRTKDGERRFSSRLRTAEDRSGYPCISCH